MTDTINIDHIKLVVPVDVLMRLKPFVSTEETRYYLNGVRFEQGSDGILLVATDGHRLGVIDCNETYASGDGIVRLPARLPKADKAERQWLIVGEFGGVVLAMVYATTTKATAVQIAEMINLSNADAIYPSPTIDGTFPDWRRVLPAKLGPRTASFNSRHLADFAIPAGQSKHGTAVTLHGDGLGDPHVVTVSGDGIKFIGVQMPMRADGIAKYPAWLDQPKRAKRKKAE